MSTSRSNASDVNTIQRTFDVLARLSRHDYVDCLQPGRLAGLVVMAGDGVHDEAVDEGGTR